MSDGQTPPTVAAVDREDESNNTRTYPVKPKQSRHSCNKRHLHYPVRYYAHEINGRTWVFRTIPRFFVHQDKSTRRWVVIDRTVDLQVGKSYARKGSAIREFLRLPDCHIRPDSYPEDQCQCQ